MKTIVLLPGYDGDGQRTFAKFNELIKSKYKVVVIDYPYLNDHSRQFSAEEIINIVNEKTEGKITILGFSMGGFLAAKYAKMFPEKIEKIILVSSSTRPVLDKKLERILVIAKILLGNKVTAYILTKLFMMSNIKDFPLPKPGKSFKPENGYAVFGSLAKIISDEKVLINNADKLAILFEDDKSFPAKIYEPILKKQNFKTVIFKTGGHAESDDYWEKVAKSL